MKKILAAMCAVMLALSLGGCSGNGESSNGPQSLDQSQSSTIPEISSTSDSSSRNAPTGTPTFLIGADGLPIYTSEITEVCIGEFGDEAIPAEQLDENTFTRVTCDGFAYIHDSRINVLAVEAPDKFDNGVYTGEELPPSTEYRRLRAGDKVGTLTVRAAKTVFSRSSEFAASGSYLESSSIWFDGEIALTGYISIYENPLYQDGMVRFVPIESTLPQMIYQHTDGTDGISHSPVLREGSYGETAEFNLGYLGGIKADMSGLKIGDVNVKVRAVIGGVRTGGGALPTYFGDLLSVEILSN